MFEGFATHDVRCEAATIHCRVGGRGAPLLLLHGFPQTHAHWHRLAPLLEGEFSLVIPDTAQAVDPAPILTTETTPNARWRKTWSSSCRCWVMSASISSRTIAEPGWRGSRLRRSEVAGIGRRWTFGAVRRMEASRQPRAKRPPRADPRAVLSRKRREGVARPEFPANGAPGRFPTSPCSRPGGPTTGRCAGKCSSRPRWSGDRQTSGCGRTAGMSRVGAWSRAAGNEPK